MQLRDRPNVILQLQERIRGMENLRPAADRSGISTGFAGLDRLLADGGLRRGTLVEWVGDGDSEGTGAATLALSVAAHMLREEGAFVAIDEAREFYPVAADHLGIPLDRTLLVRPESPKTALWAWEQALSCPGVAVTFGRIGVIDGRQFRRLQLAVETGGGLGFLMRPPDSRAGASWAGTCIRARPAPFFLPLPRLCGGEGRGEGAKAGWVKKLAPVPASDIPLTPTLSPAKPGERELWFTRRLRVAVTRGHSGTRETEIELELSHETDHVPLVAELADPVANAYAAVG